ncbi:MAG: tRNA-binding protein [Patescibacteria group bacterium]|nr:tRNA-binding protein [Patescibacteria group bacterium]
MIVTIDEFNKIDIRIGTILSAEFFPEAKKPAYKLEIDLGEVGIKRSSAQITVLYTKEELVGKKVICVTNLPPRQIGPFVSEVLTTGFYNADGYVVLAVPDQDAPNGAKLC